MNLQKYKVIVLVKHGLYQPYIELAKQGQGLSILKEYIEPEILVIHYYGKPGGPLLQKIDQFHEFLRWKSRFTNILLQALDFVICAPMLFWIPKVSKSTTLGLPNQEFSCHVIDMLLTLRWKQLSIYKYINSNYSFDYVYDTNSSSYIDFKNLLRQAKEFTASPLYAGSTPTPKFVSGSNRFFDRKALEIILKKRAFWSPSLLEDVAIGELMLRNSISITQTPTIEIPSIEALNALAAEVLEINYHFRVKSVHGGLRLDPVIMQALLARFHELRKHS